MCMHMHMPCSAHAHTHTRTHLRYIGELCARPVARVGQHMVEGLVAAVLQAVDVHRAHPRLVGLGLGVAVAVAVAVVVRGEGLGLRP